MKNISMPGRILLSLAVVVTGLFGWQPAAQASIDDFISVYKKIESAAPAGALPVSSADLIGYKSLFECIEGGKDVVVCTDEFHQTNAGKNASDQADITEGVWQVIDAYVAWKAGDTWGVVEHLGVAAACAVLQVLAGGADLCGLIQDLYDAAKDVYDAAKWVANFLGSLGEGAWDTIKDVGCSLGLGGCDSSSGPPPEYYAYEYIFAPKLDEGLQKIEQSDVAFNQLKDLLYKNARKNPAVVSKPFQIGLQTTNTWPFGSFSESVATHAAEGFAEGVDKKWSADITGKVLPNLGIARDNYFKDPSKLAQIANQAAAAYVQKSASTPKLAVNNRCVSDFQAAGYGQVDRWVMRSSHQALVAKFSALGAETHAHWCENTYWYKNTGKFAAHFHDYTKANLCPESGGSLTCQTLVKYQACVGLMGSVYQQKQCGMNVQHIGKDIANEIIAYFKSKGSKYPCEVVTMLSTPGSTSAAVLRCHRPTQQYHCNKYYQEHYGTGANKLPIQALKCDLGSKNPASYQAMEDKAWNQTIPALAKDHPGLKMSAPQKGPDPLVIGVSSQLYSELEADAKKYGIDRQIVMSWEPSIDGVETATLESNIGAGLNKMTKGTVPAFGGVNPPDPTGKLTINKMAVDSGKHAAAPAASGFGQAKSGTAGTQSGAALNPFAKPSAATGASLGAAGAPTKTMSGEMPPGFGMPSGKPGSAPMKTTAGVTLSAPSLAVVGVQAKIEANCRAPLPALTAQVTLRNSGGPLAAGTAKVHVGEIGGAQLGSADIPLPAIGPGQMTAPLRIPVTAPQPYSSLAGRHQLQVILEPAITGGQPGFHKPPGRPYMLTVDFPAGHCRGANSRSLPSGGIQRNSSGVQLPAVQLPQRH